MARKRIDPVSRTASGVRPWDRIRNQDPTRHYVLANPNDNDTGVAYYLGLGYEVERWRKDGPVPLVAHTLKDGDEITVKGQVLMSISNDDHLKIDEEGRAYVDELERKMVKPGGVDGLRGLGNGAEIVNETSGAFIEKGV